MSTSEDDSDVPEQVSLSTSKQQVIGRKKDVAKELAQVGSKRKEHNRERDRQLKQQSSKQRTDLIPDEESSSEEDEVAKDPRLLPDHLFAAAFNQPSPEPGPSVPKDAPRKIQQKVRKRAYLTPKDRIIGSRAVRTLSKTSDRGAAKRTLPSPPVSKFSSRALNAKGIASLSQTRGWQRRAANTGVLKTTNGPAAHFARTGAVDL